MTLCNFDIVIGSKIAVLVFPTVACKMKVVYCILGSLSMFWCCLKIHLLNLILLFAVFVVFGSYLVQKLYYFLFFFCVIISISLSESFLNLIADCVKVLYNGIVLACSICLIFCDKYMIQSLTIRTTTLFNNSPLGIELLIVL